MVGVVVAVAVGVAVAVVVGVVVVVAVAVVVGVVVAVAVAVVVGVVVVVAVAVGVVVVVVVADIMTFLFRLWCSLNYRYCMSSAYLASQRGENDVAANWESAAMDWQREYLMVGRRMV